MWRKENIRKNIVCIEEWQNAKKLKCVLNFFEVFLLLNHFITR
jgi:hypothetical protein